MVSAPSPVVRGAVAVCMVRHAHINSPRAAVVDIQLGSVIRKALADAWAQGSDLETANKKAVARVLAKRADMTAADALRMVNLVRRS